MSAWRAVTASIVSLSAWAMATGCSSKATPSVPPPPPPAPTLPDPDPLVPPYEGDHPIDAVTHPRFFRAGHTPIPAGRAELCRRLFADLIGRYPTLNEVERDCAKPIDDIITDLQGRPEYLLVGRRRWRDRMRTSDISSDWRYLKSLYELVDRLHQGTLSLSDFVKKASGHPGFVINFRTPRERADAAFWAFIGRRATIAESVDLAGLYRVWTVDEEDDPEILLTRRLRAYVVPQLCSPIARCGVKVLATTQMIFEPGLDDRVAYENLRPRDITQLETPGAVLVQQPYFYENAADELLDRYLQYSDGGIRPRTVGSELPEVRQAVAQIIAEERDYRAAERVVLTSWLYRQTAVTQPPVPGETTTSSAAPVWTSGPMKAASAEVWLDSAATLTGALGRCDPRYADNFSFAYLLSAVMSSTISDEILTREVEKLHRLQGNLTPLQPRPGEAAVLDLRYQQLSRLIGGCPGFEFSRKSADGLAYAYAQEYIAENICRNVDRDPNSTVSGVLTRQMGLLFARAPTEDEVTTFQVAFSACNGSSCDPRELENSICVALLGSAEMLFY